MRAAGRPPNVVTFTSLLSAYGAWGDLAAARGVLEEMRGAGVRPGVKTYTELMLAFSRRGEARGGWGGCGMWGGGGGWVGWVPCWA